MRIKFTTKTTFSFHKLGSSMKKMIEDFKEDTIKSEAGMMRSRLQRGATINGKMDKLRPVTLLTRSLRKQSIMKPPLNATGKLLNSIKERKHGISGKEYGHYHSEGFTTQNRPIIPSSKRVPKGHRKQQFNFKGKSIPARKWIHDDKTFMYNPKILKKFKRAIARNLKK